MTQIKEALDMLKNPHFRIGKSLSLHINCSYDKASKNIDTIRHILEKLADGHVIVPIDPSEGMLFAVHKYKKDERAKTKVNPMYGACACMGPPEMCFCEKRERANEYKAMIAAYQEGK